MVIKFSSIVVIDACYIISVTVQTIIPELSTMSLLIFGLLYCFVVFVC